MPQEGWLESEDYMFPETKQGAEVSACPALYPLVEVLGGESSWSVYAEEPRAGGLLAQRNVSFPVPILNGADCQPLPCGNPGWLLVPWLRVLSSAGQTDCGPLAHFLWLSWLPRDSNPEFTSGIFMEGVSASA